MIRRSAKASSRIDWKLELVRVPTASIDRAKAFYTDKVGFYTDVDHQPPSSATTRTCR